MAAVDDGYALYQAVLDTAEVRSLLAQIEAQSILRSRAGARHVLGCAPVAAVARDPRLLEIASGWLDAPALPFKATLFDKNPGSNWLVAWHQDTALPLAAQVANREWGPWSSKDGIHYAHAPAIALQRVIALRLHLDDSSTDNGPLRVLPGSHELGVLTDAQVLEHSRHVVPRHCCLQAGGVIAMRPLIIHASSKCTGSRPRRVLHIEYAASMEIVPGMRLRAA